MRMIEVAIVIANWNGKEYLEDCFDSLAAQTIQNFKIVFVDNGSSDDSVDFVRENYSSGAFINRLEIIKLEKNTGFAKGYNIGIEKALKDENIKWVIALNNDTQLDGKYIEELIKCARKYPEAGSIQPKVLNFFEKGKIDCAGILLSADGVAVNRDYGERDRGQYEKEEEIFGANATAALFSRDALEKTRFKPGEYFDEDYFAYYEDVDLAWRMRLAGFASYYCPIAKLYHVHSATANKISGLKAYYLNRNRFFTLIKNYPLCRLAVILLVLTPIRYIFLLFRVIMKKGGKSAEFSGQSKIMVAKVVLRAWGSVIANIPDLVRKRRAIRSRRSVDGKEVQKWFKKYKVYFSKTF